MGPVRDDERRSNEDEGDDMGVATIFAALGLGLLAGAVAMLLTTPESGEAVRTRLKRGMDRARRELDEIVEESKESWNVVRDDTREAVKRTATRIKEAAKVTKEALVEGEQPKPKTP